MGNSGLRGVAVAILLIWGALSVDPGLGTCPLPPPSNAGWENAAPLCALNEIDDDAGGPLDVPQTDVKSAVSPTSLSTEPFYEFLQSNKSLGVSLKHRYDFATFDSGARIVAAARSLKDVRAIQKPSSEAYMIGPCDEPTWVVVSLPERISLEYLAFHFSELYSSYYSKIAILGASAYPTDEWRLLTLLSVEPAQPANYFDLRPTCSRYNNPACWVTHLKYQVISYSPVANSKICTLSRWQVFGSTLMQGLESKLKTAASTTEKPVPSSRPFRAETCPAAVTSDPFFIGGGTQPRLETAAPAETATERQRLILKEAIEVSGGAISTEDTVDKWRSLYGHLGTAPSQSNALRRQLEGDNSAVILPRELPKPSQVMDRLTRLLNENLQASSTSFTRPPPPLRDGAPPLLALVDRVADIEKQVDAQTNLTLARLSLIREVIAGVSAMSESLETILPVVEASLDRILVHDIVSERLLQSDLGGRLLRLSCLKALESFELFDASSVRSQCLVAAYLSAGSPLLSSTTTASQFVNLLLSMQQFGLRQMINLKLQQLQAQLSFGMTDNKDFSAQEFVSANNAYKAGKLYLTFLRENQSFYGLREAQRLLASVVYLAARLLTLLQTCTGWLLALMGRKEMQPFDFLGYASSFPGLFQGWTTDPICLYIAVRIVEISASLSLWLLVKISLFFLLIDCAIRTRENDSAIQTLANYLTMLEEDHPHLARPHDNKFVRNAKTWSVASSSARGGLNKVLAGSLDLRKYIGPFRKRQRRKPSPRPVNTSEDSDDCSDLFGAPRKIYAATSCRSSPISQDDLDPKEHPAAWSSPINRPSPIMRRSSTPLLSLFVRGPSHHVESNDDYFITSSPPDDYKRE